MYVTSYEIQEILHIQRRTSMLIYISSSRMLNNLKLHDESETRITTVSHDFGRKIWSWGGRRGSGGSKKNQIFFPKKEITLK